MTTPARLVPTIGRLTVDDLEQLAFLYGGELERNLRTEQYSLVGAVIDGRTVTLGPVPGPVRVAS